MQTSRGSRVRGSQQRKTRKIINILEALRAQSELQNQKHQRQRADQDALALETTRLRSGM